MRTSRLRLSLVALATSLCLVACGGGDDGPSATAPSAACDVAAQNDWLRSYFLDKYYWSGSSPNPDPAGFTSLASYFNALKYTNYGGPGVVEPWSGYQDSVSYNQFFAEGQTLGYGLFVNGNERQLPLRARLIEPQSPAGAAGLQRGDVIVSVNGVPSSTVITGDFAVLNPAQAGDQLALVIERAGVQLPPVTLTAALYTLTPVPVTNVLTLPNGTKAGYLVLKDFITQAEAPVVSALASFRAQGATEVIVDLRYNGGGRVSTANLLASQIVGAVHGSKLFTRLVYNAGNQASNSNINLTAAPAPAFGRVVVLTGSRTCSASELVVNGLAPYVNVVTIGGATCGKPYGFNPVASCGNTFSVVNFQARNANGFGSYENGLTPTCPVADEFTGALGDPAEKLTGAAMSYLSSGSCPTATAKVTPLSAVERARLSRVEPGERQGMVAD